ncbi:MAG: hypothetical protein P3X23_005495 [Thermosynechococcus sp. Uc]|nr:hypothetical protein [Thermosynechococcus sp. Uc]MDM7326558.1 hypothetical protein [Thermosynechococcus sp. Uc]
MALTLAALFPAMLITEALIQISYRSFEFKAYRRDRQTIWVA